MAGDAMSDDIIDTIAAHSRRVDYNHPAYGKCRCGIDPDDLPGNETHADHVLAALRERYAVVPLPEPPIAGFEYFVKSNNQRCAIVELPESGENGPFTEWRFKFNPAAVVWTEPGAHVMIQNIEPGDLMPSDARDVAAAILAAADVADRSEERIAAAEADQ